MENKDTEFSLEEAFAGLEQKIQHLEAEDISLEDSFREYSEGMDLLRKSNEYIDLIEKKVQVLEGNGESHEF